MEGDKYDLIFTVLGSLRQHLADFVDEPVEVLAVDLPPPIRREALALDFAGGVAVAEVEIVPVCPIEVREFDAVAGAQQTLRHIHFEVERGEARFSLERVTDPAFQPSLALRG